MNKIPILVCSLCLLASVPLSAKENEKSWYGSIFGGVALFGDSEVDVKTNDSGSAVVEIDDGYVAGLRVGYDLGKFRLEGEYAYMQGDIGKLMTSTGDVDVDSDVRTNALMLNGVFDFDFDSFVLSAGVGVGLSSIKFGEMISSGFTAVSEISGTVFSGQGILEARYRISDTASIGLDYRYFATGGLSDEGYVDTEEGGGLSDIDYDGLGVSRIEVFFTFRF